MDAIGGSRRNCPAGGKGAIVSGVKHCIHLGAGLRLRPKKLNRSCLSMLGLPFLWPIEPVDSRLMVELGVTGLDGMLAAVEEMVAVGVGAMG